MSLRDLLVANEILKKDWVYLQSEHKVGFNSSPLTNRSRSIIDQCLKPAINFLNEENRVCTLEIVLGIRSLGLAELDLCNCSTNYI